MEICEIIIVHFQNGWKINIKTNKSTTNSMVNYSLSLLLIKGCAEFHSHLMVVGIYSILVR